MTTQEIINLWNKGEADLTGYRIEKGEIIFKFKLTDRNKKK